MTDVTATIEQITILASLSPTTIYATLAAASNQTLASLLDVTLTSLSDNNILQYNASLGVWTNRATISLSAGGLLVGDIQPKATEIIFKGYSSPSNTNGINVVLEGGDSTDGGNGGMVYLTGGQDDPGGDIIHDGFVATGNTMTGFNGSSYINPILTAGNSTNDFGVEGSFYVGGDAIFAAGIGLNGKLCPFGWIFLGTGETAQSAGLDRINNAGVSGVSLTIHAGWGKYATNNTNGGTLYLAPGHPTGTGTGRVALQAAGGGSSGSTDVTPIDVAYADYNKFTVLKATEVNDQTLSRYSASISVNSGTTYTLASTDNGKVLEFSNGSAITLTLPNSLSQGFCCTIAQTGAGQVTLSAASGATLRNRASFTKTAGQYAELTLYVTSNSNGSLAVYMMAGDGA